MLRYLCFSLFVLFTVEGYGQRITGRVHDNAGKAVAGGNILLKDEKKILAYGRTNATGEFEFSVASPVDQDAFLEFNHISYATQRVPWKAGEQHYHIVAVEKSHEIKEVSIGRAVPIRQRQDTLTFSVRAFADSIDRNIGDVLRRMPGFSVSESGKISYNGQDISNFFIDGDDLLGSKYGLGTRTIPHEIIQAIEVYRNHQSIKALQDKVNSNEIAINLKVMDEARAKWVGEGNVGAGLPKQYFAEVNTLLFNSSIKTLNALMANNTGADVEANMRDLTQVMEDSRLAFMLGDGRSSFLGGTKHDFYANNSIGAFSNILFNKGDWAYRSNLSFYMDRSLLDRFTEQRFVLGENDIRIADHVSSAYKPMVADMRLNLMRNAKDNYINNQFVLKVGRYRTSDKVLSDELSLHQQFQQYNKELSNYLQFIPRNEGINIWRFNWRNTLFSRPEDSRTQASAAIPGLKQYGQSTNAIQTVHRKAILSEVDINYTIGASRKIHQHYGAEVSFRAENLDTQGPYLLDFQNNLAWQQLQGNIFAAYQLNSGRWRLNTKIPLGLQRIAYSDKGFDVQVTKQKPVFSPQAFLQLTVKQNHRFSTEYFAKQSYGVINDVYRAYILSDFRTLRRSGSGLPFTRTHHVSPSYSIEAPAQMLFTRLTYTYSGISTNIQSQMRVDANSIDIEYIDKNNKAVNHEWKVSISKYVTKLSGSSTLNISYAAHNADMILNSHAAWLTTHIFYLQPSIQGKMKQLQWSYRGTWSKNWASRLATDALPDRSKTTGHYLSLSHTYRTRFFTTINSNLYRIENGHNRDDFFLLGANVRYKAKNKVEYLLELSNLLDKDQNELYFLEPGYSFYQQHTRRGRMALAKVIFTF